MLLQFSGPATAIEIRKLGYKGIIIGVTGSCYQEHLDEFLEAGADSVLQKPLTLSILLDEIRSI